MRPAANDPVPLLRAALVAWAATVAAAPAAAEPVRIAVVGFTGELSSQELSDLASSLRGSLTRQVDQRFLAVVTRDEMAAVYGQRGGACRPDDLACIVEVSYAWSGRLFVRGVVRKSNDGIVVSATLESVRGVLVAASQTPPSPKWDMGTAVPILARELLDGEKAYRKRNFAPATAAAAPAGPVECRCQAGDDAAGDLRADAGGVRFDAPGGGAAARFQWRYLWAHVAKVDATTRGGRAAITLVSTTNDAVTLAFARAGDRDKCLTALTALSRQAR